jgi:hypothetical protein
MYILILTISDQASLFFGVGGRLTYAANKTPGFFLVDARKFLAVHLEYFVFKFMQIVHRLVGTYGLDGCNK